MKEPNVSAAGVLVALATVLLYGCGNRLTEEKMELERTVSELREDVGRLRAEMSSNSTELAAQKQKVVELSERLNLSNSQLNGVKEERDALKQSLKRVELELKTERDKNAEREKTLKKFRDRTEACLRIFRGLQSILEESIKRDDYLRKFLDAKSDVQKELVGFPKSEARVIIEDILTAFSEINTSWQKLTQDFDSLKQKSEIEARRVQLDYKLTRVQQIEAEGEIAKKLINDAFDLKKRHLNTVTANRALIVLKLALLDTIVEESDSLE